MYQETFTFNNVDICDSLIAFLKYNCDHITIKRNDFCYYLILHGCEDGHVCFNNQICTFEELNDLFREEQDLSSTQNICVNVFCCFGQLNKNTMMNTRKSHQCIRIIVF